eukprot:m.354065 g.354065  ORF g.354065 m.354065 type:complete len:333 (-) comp16594_c0_seq1:1387-2385(-)
MSFGLKAEPTPIGSSFSSADGIGSCCCWDSSSDESGRVPDSAAYICTNQCLSRCDVSEVNAHTAVLGSTGDGKTHLAVHLIMQWAPVKGWNHGWAAAIMPKSTWMAQCKNGVLRFWQRLLEGKQVYFIDDYPTKKQKTELMERIRLTTADNMVHGVSSLLIIDDCVTELLNGSLPITALLTNGLTVVSLWQSPVRTGTVGNIVRQNKATVVFFPSMIATVATVPQWVPSDQVRELEATMWMPTTLLKNEFIIPIRVQHYSITCSRPGSALIQTSKGNIVGQRRVGIAGNTNGAFYRFGSPVNTPGLYINTTVPCYLVVDGVLDGDELIIYGE